MKHWVFITVVAIFGRITAQTPSADLDEFGKLRSTFEQRLRTATAPFASAFSKRFADEEEALAKVGDYEHARVAKARSAELAVLGLSAETASAISLLPAAARTFGAVTLRSGELQGWRTASCAAEWTRSKIPFGTYNVIVTYTMKAKEIEPGAAKRPDAPTASETAAYVFREVSLLSSATKNQCPLALMMTKAGAQDITSSAIIEINRSPITMRLASTQSLPANVITVKEVKLVPVAKASAVSASAPAAPDLLASVRALTDTFAAAFKTAREPIIDAYVKQLETIASTASDDAVDEAVEAEKRRALRLKTTTSSKGDDGGRFDNYDELANAHFVPSATNTGDTFSIEHDGKTQRVRLAFVLCPSAGSTTTKAMKTVLDRFSIDAATGLSLARDAQEFTAQYLEGRSLTVLIKHSRKPEPIATALVVLPDIGLFQGVLIDHGFAVLDPASASKTGIDADYLSALAEREDKARAMSPRPGGWARPSPQ